MSRKKKPDSVLKEAWDNMCEDFAKVLPAAFAAKPGKRKWGWHVVVLVTALELVVLGAIGTFLYNWFKG